MIISRTYEEARLDAIHILSTYDNYPTIITIIPRERNGKIEWCLEYEEQFQKEMENEE